MDGAGRYGGTNGKESQRALKEKMPNENITITCIPTVASHLADRGARDARNFAPLLKKRVCPGACVEVV